MAICISLRQCERHFWSFACRLGIYIPVSNANLDGFLAEVSVGELQERGFEIVACFGDQWSDLAGTSPGLASFKLPNPMYYIL